MMAGLIHSRFGFTGRPFLARLMRSATIAKKISGAINGNNCFNMRTVPGLHSEAILAEVPSEGTAAFGFQQQHGFLAEASLIGLADRVQLGKLVRRAGERNLIMMEAYLIHATED